MEIPSTTLSEEVGGCDWLLGTLVLNYKNWVLDAEWRTHTYCRALALWKMDALQE